MLVIELEEDYGAERMERQSARELMSSMLARRVEQLDCEREDLVVCDTMHALVSAARKAFYEHYPLVLSPDDVWFCIVSGFAHHMSLNHESLRERFVSHKGKKKLVVNRPDFTLGEQNPWPEVFASFSEQIATHIGQKTHDLLSARFSTTRPMHVVAYDVSVMDSFEGYFEYEMMIGCGIPEMRVLGTREDWEGMIPRLQALAEYGLGDWVDVLIPVIERCAQSFDGDPDLEFWRSCFRYRAGSGGADMTGWLSTLFPYIYVWEGGENRLSPNPFMAQWSERFACAMREEEARVWPTPQGPDMGSIPQALVSAPVRLFDVRKQEKLDMRFVAGMMGVHQEPADGALSTAFGWAVLYEHEGKPQDAADA